MASLASLSSTTQDTPSYYGIYTGLWTNWSRGAVLGSTITLSRRDGALLIAFTAFFITIVSTAFWRISCFAFHTLFSTADARDGLHHQRQALLRNSANGASGLCSLLLVLWSWRSGRNEAKHAYSRLLPLIAFTTITMIAFAIASGFSSTISSGMGNEVLISSARCGMSNSDDNNTFFNIMNSYIAQGAATSFIYAQQCYSNTSNPQSCGTYVKQRLPATVERNAGCPFSEEMCYTQDGNIRIDSGLIDSNDDLGINTPPSLRFQFRQTLECAPLNTTEYQVQHNYTGGGTSELFRQYWLGPANGSDYIYEHKELLLDSINRTAEQYELSSTSAYSMNSSFDIPWTMFYPIAPLRAPSADVSLYFLAANAIRFAQPTSDPWYAAHRAGGDAGQWSSSYALSRVYLQDAPASVLGCATRNQWCNPNLPAGSRCTPLGSTIDAVLAYPAILRNEEEEAFFRWVRRVKDSGWSSPYDLVSVLGVSALNARQKMRWGLQGPLPDDQWQGEVEGWFDMALAGLQLSYREAATGPADPGIPMDGATVGDPHCGTQKMRSTAYVNVSTLGLLVIFLVGGAVVLLSYVVEPLAACVGSRRHRRGRGGRDHHHDYSRLEWTTNDVLQMQRLAHEELGLGAWRNCDGAVPTTEKAGELLGVLDIADPRHPRLKRPAAAEEESTVFEEVSPEEAAVAAAREREREEGEKRAGEEREVEVSPTVSGTLTDGGEERWPEREEQERDRQRRGSV